MSTQNTPSPRKQQKNPHSTNWTKSSPRSLRTVYRYRIQNDQPIEPELNAALAARFANYDAKTQTFTSKRLTHTQKIDWSQSSNATLRKRYLYRKRHNIPIDDSLNSILAMRFKTYNPQTQTFVQSKNNMDKDWATKSNKCLREAYRYRIKNNMPIEPELHAALAARFSIYDPETQLFTQKRKTPTKYKKPAKDWSTASKDSVRKAYKYRIQNNQPIEPELNAALAVRFSEYDANTQTFGKRTNKPHKDWSKKSDESLRCAYKYRIKNNQPIEPELNTVLAARFPEYDAKKHIFKPTKFGNTRTKFTTPIDWTKSSYDSVRKAYRYRIKNNMPIEPELNAALAARFTNYDPEKQVFVKKTIDITKTQEKQKLRKMYREYRDRGLPIPDKLNTLLAQRFIEYDGARRVFTHYHPGKEDCTVLPQPIMPASNLRRIDWSEKSDDELRDAYNNRKDSGISDALNQELAKRFASTYDASRRIFVSHNPNTPDAQSSGANTKKSEKKLVVTMTQVYKSDNGIYNDIYVNGRRVLQNHKDTELQLLGNGTLLGIYGTVTIPENYPARPVWTVFDTELQQHRSVGVSKYSGQLIYIRQVISTPQSVRIYLTNGTTIEKSIGALQKQAQNKIFEIRQKQT